MTNLTKNTGFISKYASQLSQLDYGIIWNGLLEYKVWNSYYQYYVAHLLCGKLCKSTY